MFLLDREAFRITRRLVGWILQQNVQSHNIQYALRHVQKPFIEYYAVQVEGQLCRHDGFQAAADEGP